VQCVRSDESTFEAAVASLDAPGGRLLTVSDLTGLRQSAQAQRLEAIGRLAGGVAHDVNNLLMALSGTGALLRDEAAQLDDPSSANELLDDVDACVERGGNLTRELMAFGRRQLLSPVVVVAQDVVRGVEPLLRRAVRDDVRLVVELDPEAVSLRVDAAQLELAILNLVLNGMAAMPNGGDVRVRVYGTAEHAVFEVQDSGEGIPADVLPHIYEPFFTTRAVGNGLGLPSVHGFAAQSGGELHCETTVGSGTLFRIRLPSTPAEPPGPSPEEPSVRSSSGRVLVCDDDEQVLEALTRMLRVGGFTVLAFLDAREACNVDPHTIDALVTDVLMPTLRGPELAALLRRRRPELPVLYVSGYTHDIDLSPAPGPLLNKPFRIAALLEAVSDLLIEDSSIE
jgi:nitrogen-specific signal transduction histidine kinase/CheY-like chemotaxis protein